MNSVTPIMATEWSVFAPSKGDAGPLEEGLVMFGSVCTFLSNRAYHIIW